MSLDLIKELRVKTSAGVIDCKKALAEANGNIEKAIKILREKGIAKAVKKFGRIANQGIITAYIHPGAQLGVLVELNCETDFVAKTDEFKKLADEIALQIAATDPAYVSRDEVPTELIEKEREIYKKQFEGDKKPANVVEKIIAIKEHIAKFGENILIGRFVRFKIGEV